MQSSVKSNTTMTENMEIAISAINKWMYFGWNYDLVEHQWTDMYDNEHQTCVPRFLVEIDWGTSFCHMYDKWRYYYVQDSKTALFQFYCDIDIRNRIKLLEYVIANFNNEQKLFSAK